MVIVGCGGGSEDKIPPSPVPITVSANVDLVMDEQTSVNISGAASGGDGVFTYSWQVPADFGIEHTDTSIPDAILTAPSLITQTQFDVTLVVRDAKGTTSSDTFVVTVMPVNIAPTAVVTVNQIDGYSLNHYPVDTSIMLDASNSSDTDAPDQSQPIASYQWQQISGVDITQGLDLTAAVLEIVTPIDNVQNAVTMQLTVTDHEGAQHSVQQQLTLVGQSGTLPELTFIQPSDVFSGERILLSAIPSSKAPAAAPFSVVWEVQNPPSNVTVFVDNAQSAQTFALAPLVEQDYELIVNAQLTDSFGNQLSQSQTITVYPQRNATINDTGISRHGSLDAVSFTYDPAYAGQDADYGNDRISLSGISDKAGRGDKGFDFTRLNTNGDQVDDENLPWECVRDNTTGLVWENKMLSDSAHIQYADSVFTWYSEDENGGFEGAINAASASCNLTSQNCNTQAYVDAINQQGLCGFYDWRLPSHEELQSIMHYGSIVGVAADVNFFPVWSATTQSTLWYWTSQSSADGVNNDTARNAWAFDFVSGVDNFINKNTELRVRLVRAGRGN